MLGINTNISSLTAQRNLAGTSRSLNTAIQRLSSGLRVNSGKDDAAGLAISEKFRAQINGQEVAKRNANDGISFLEVADGALSSMGDSLQRMRELAVQAKNGTLSDADRANLNLEFKTLSEEVLRVSNDTQFNGNKTFGDINGAGATIGSLSVQINEGGSLAGAALDIDLSTTANGARANIDTALRGTVAVATADNFSVQYTDAGAPGTASDFNITSALDADNAIKQLDKAIGLVTTSRAKVGTGVSRLESVIGNLDTSIASLSSARGRIIDADFAKETAALTRAQILQQAGTTVLAQANQLPSNVLGLLR